MKHFGQALETCCIGFMTAMLRTQELIFFLLNEFLCHIFVAYKMRVYSIFKISTYTGCSKVNQQFCLSVRFVIAIYPENWLHFNISSKFKFYVTKRRKVYCTYLCATDNWKYCRNYNLRSWAQRPTYQMHCIPSSKLNKTLREIIISVCLSNTPLLFLISRSTESETWKKWACRILAITTIRRRSVCFKCHRGIEERPSEQSISPNILYRLHRGAQSILVPKSVMTVVAILKGERIT